MNHISFRERIMTPSDLSNMTAAEREAYVRGLEVGAAQLAAGLDIDRLTIIAALREQAKIIRAGNIPVGTSSFPDRTYNEVESA